MTKNIDPTLSGNDALHQASARWWARVRCDPRAFEDWLYDQFRGEHTAAGRIERLRDAFCAPAQRSFRVLTVIARQERRHAQWVGELLATRGLRAEVPPAEERYWAQTLPGVRDLRTGAAVGAHAERMRLARIETICADPAAPADVRRVFRRILPQERFHERAFRSLTDPAALQATAGAHELGMQVLGLRP